VHRLVTEMTLIFSLVELTVPKTYKNWF